MTKRFPNLFLAISFHDDDKDIRVWFKQILSALDFNVIEGDLPTPVPPHEKVRTMIRDEADCVLFVFTRRKKIEGSDEWVGPEWLHQEIGMAYQDNKNIGILIENGINSEGIIPAIVTYERFSSEELIKYVPVLVKYLIEFRSIVTGTEAYISEDKISIIKAVANELWGHLENILEKGSIPKMKWNLSYYYVKITGRIYLLPDNLVVKIETTYARIDEFYLWVRSIADDKWTPFFKVSGDRVALKETKGEKDVIQQIDDARQTIVSEILDTYLELMDIVEPRFKEDFINLISQLPESPSNQN